jgi:NADPH:quinone reductase-like Zn-dependent oxidoreductase
VTVAPPATLFRRLNTAVARRERGRRGDHGAVLPARYWSKPCVGADIVRLLTYVLGDPAHHGVVPTAECRARAVVVHVACDGVGVPVVEVARLLGVSAAAVSSARPRGSRLLAELGWTVDDVVAWSVRPG